MGDAGLFAMIFAGEGASVLKWEQGARCSCNAPDSRQPSWDCRECGGLGCVFVDAQQIRGLFRGQSRWTTPKLSGEHPHGEAQLTTPLDVKPAYVDQRVRDRFTVLQATGDVEAGRVFYPAAHPVPFLFDGVQRAWRVQLQGMTQSTRARPQP